ncbi:arsenical-resistance protein [Rheinheimera sp. SA_1]|uniref:ACR3 family arsenite efflux transporter n=1 Tax=Rheinheimera sp. SA_1 TaxID=1827365 RepID=UPI0007FE4850|nr:ACR3 family arsenite efflux transporter [Rheinheimera sp. SA_1]OBP16299.1 arsenical-resistance protein [Rheinheimera sp. SA_1]
MGIFERYLSWWVALAMLVGVVGGSWWPALFQTVAVLEYAQVNAVIAVFIWVMIYPMMVQIDFSAIKKIGKKPQGLMLTLVVNWLIKPFTMAFLGWLFFRVLFVDWVDPQTATEYIAGMILLGVAPCTAMVFVWSQLTKGDANYTLVQVSVNDIIMIFAFAPITALLLGVSDIVVPWSTLFLSVLLYVVLPLSAGVITRKLLLPKSSNGTDPQRLTSLLGKLKPWSLFGLLATVVLLFGFQAQTILSKPLAILLIAIPLLIQTYGIFALTYFAGCKLQLPHNVAAPAGMIGASNFFELAVAVAISLFGLHSGAALATVVGVLVEVPVMLSLVWFANRTRHWFAKAKS